MENTLKIPSTEMSYKKKERERERVVTGILEIQPLWNKMKQQRGGRRDCGFFFHTTKGSD